MLLRPAVEVAMVKTLQEALENRGGRANNEAQCAQKLKLYGGKVTIHLLRSEVDGESCSEVDGVVNREASDRGGSGESQGKRYLPYPSFNSTSPGSSPASASTLISGTLRRIADFT